MNNMVSKTAE